MSTLAIPNRPFATELITGLMLPDGIFEASLGRQEINAQVTNAGSSPTSGGTAYVEGVSHPSISVTPVTHTLASLSGGATTVLSWEADFSAAPPGVHHVSFVFDTASGRTRIIKKIFVTRLELDETTMTFSTEVPEGRLDVRFHQLVEPVDDGCCPRRELDTEASKELSWMLTHVGQLFQGRDDEFLFCPPGYLPLRLEAGVTPTPPYDGQYGDLPFEDPWWKIVLCVVAVVLLIAAAVVASQEGGSVVVTTGDGGSTPDGAPEDCCGVEAEGGSSSYAVAGLVAAAAAAATAAGMSDERDPFRRGQDHTEPAKGELTVAESLNLQFLYEEPVALGRPFAVGLDWEYTRTTTGGTYTHSASDSHQNVHVLSRYEITAPDVVTAYSKEAFTLGARFFDEDDELLSGDDLFVQCFLIGPDDQFVRLRLEDDGLDPDAEPDDGVYTGEYFFGQRERDPRGMWVYYVIAQDVNDADPDMDPEEAAKIIGGMVRTHQLTISFTESGCPLIPDGHVQVV